MQKRTVAICAFVSLALLSGCGGMKFMQAVPPLTQPRPDNALVKIHRPSSIGFAIDFSVWDRDRFIGMSTSGTTILYECPPGDHLFIAQSENTSIVKANLEPGRVYDLVAEVKMGVFKARVNLVPASTHPLYRARLAQYDATLRSVVVYPAMSQQYEQARRPGIAGIAAQFDQGRWRGRYTQMGPVDSR